MKLFISILFFSFISLHCAKKENLQTTKPTEPSAPCENQNCDESLLLAISKGDFAKAKALLEAGANPNYHSIKKSKRTAFHTLTYADDEQESINFLPTLLKHEADINAQDENGKTTLTHAIENEKYLLAQKLLQNEDIDLSIQDNTGSNIIHIFSEVNLTHPLALQILNTILSKMSADVINAKNKKEQAPLHLAVDNKNIELLKALASHPHININITDGNGNTPILLSLASAYLATSQLLFLTKEVPTASQLDKINQTLQILLNSSHEVDFTIENNANRSSYDILFNIGALAFTKSSQEKAPPISPSLAPAFKAMLNTLDSIDKEKAENYYKNRYSSLKKNTPPPESSD